VLANAARMYEEITGKDVNIEEGAIAEALKAVATADLAKLIPLEARLSALKLPGADAVREQLQWAQGILEMPADDCVKTLAGDGKAYLEGRQRATKLEKLATDANIQTIATARRVLSEQWPHIASRQPDDDLVKSAADLEERLQSDTALEEIESLRLDAESIATTYRATYTSAFEKRSKAYAVALEEVKGHPDWLILDERFTGQPDQLAALIAPLTQRTEPELDLPAGASTCRRTAASLGQLQSDIEAVEAIAKQVLRKVMELAAPPEEKPERIAVARLYPGRITNKEELDAFVDSLKDRLEKALAQGATIILE
jgi:hypothetical protein